MLPDGLLAGLFITVGVLAVGLAVGWRAFLLVIGLIAGLHVKLAAMLKMKGSSTATDRRSYA